MSFRTNPFTIRVEEGSLASYREAAKRAGMTVSEWARLVLDVAAGAKEIRHVYFIDVKSMGPDEALEHVRDVGKKVRTGKW